MHGLASFVNRYAKKHFVSIGTANFKIKTQNTVQGNFLT